MTITFKPLRLRAGGSLSLPQGSSEADIDEAGRKHAEELAADQQKAATDSPPQLAPQSEEI